MKILILGASGLLGNAVFRVLSEKNLFEVYGTIRKLDVRSYFTNELQNNLLQVENILDEVQLNEIIRLLHPSLIINCVALRKEESKNLLELFSVFSLLPIRLSYICRKLNIRLIQISSDGVFQGTRGNYEENDLPDAKDPYGISKYLGEVERPGSITIRTSIIGPELQTKAGLLEWFLSQQHQCRCYTKSIFSGLPSIILAQVIRDIIISRPDLHGIYHIASQSISKFDLLQLVAKKYSKSINIVPDDTVVIDRSLSAEKFKSATGYVPPEWPTLIDKMHNYKFGLMEI